MRRGRRRAWCGKGKEEVERQWRMSIGEERALESVMEAEGIVWGRRLRDDHEEEEDGET